MTTDALPSAPRKCPNCGQPAHTGRCWRPATATADALVLEFATALALFSILLSGGVL